MTNFSTRLICNAIICVNLCRSVADFRHPLYQPIVTAEPHLHGSTPVDQARQLRSRLSQNQKIP